MEYGELYERCMLKPVSPLQRWFIGVMRRRLMRFRANSLRYIATKNAHP